jgi:2-iminobutanoate/2-iminopropanoate deaminase
MTSFTPGKRSLHVQGLGHGNTPIPMGARVGNLLCSSGINGADASTGKLPEDPLAQVKHAFANMQSVLAAGGAVLSDVVKLTVYLKDSFNNNISQKAMREAINVEWIACFPEADDRPARHILIYDLQNGMALQLEVTAMIQSVAQGAH